MTDKATAKVEVNETLLGALSIGEQKNVVVIDNDVVTKELEDRTGLSIKELRKVQSATNDVTADLTKAIGVFGVDHMKQNKDINEVEAQFETGKQTTNVVVYRSHEVSTGIGSKGEKQTRYGYVRAHTKAGPVQGRRDEIRKAVCSYGETVLK